MEQVSRCTWSPRSSELRDALGGHEGSSLEVHQEAVIKQVWRCNWRPTLNQLRDALGRCQQVSLESHLAAESE
jgi:hypothetical protein